MKRSAASYALLLLKNHLRTKKELERKLLEKKYEPTEVVETLKKLEELDIINDERFAKVYTNDKLAFARRGRYRIRLELYKKGVAKDLIDRALANVKDNDELAIAEDLLKARQRQWAKDEPLKRYRKIVQLLQRRGFSGKIITELTRELKSGRTSRPN